MGGSNWEEWEPTGVPHSELSTLLHGFDASKRKRTTIGDYLKAYYGPAVGQLITKSPAWNAIIKGN